jgi:hypothetical protein
MRASDIKVGATVYHTTYVSWGRGEVMEVRDSKKLDKMFASQMGKWWIIVKFEGLDGDGKASVVPKQLRITPNIIKMRNLCEFYEKRGTKARISDSKERLIIGDEA